MPASSSDTPSAPADERDTPAPSEVAADKEIALPVPSSSASSQSQRAGDPIDSCDHVEARQKSVHGPPAEQLPPPDPQEPVQQSQNQPRSRLKIALIMFSLGISVLLVALDITIVTTALPTIAEHFQSASGYTWVGSAYLIANAAATPIWGKVSDIFGRKPILLVTNVIFFVGSLLAAVAVNMSMLIAARVIQGIGGGGLIVLVNISISDLFAMRERGAYFGIIGGVWALASSLGPVVGGAFTQNVSWRWCFYINLPLDGLAFFILLFVLDLHTPKTPIAKGLKAVDWLGSLTMVAGTIMLLLGLEFGGITYPWNSATVICLIVFGALTIAIFFAIEYRLAPYPLMPLDIFSKRSNLAALGVCFFHAYVFISGSYFLPLYFQAVLGATPILSGVYLLPTALSLSFLSHIPHVHPRVLLPEPSLCALQLPPFLKPWSHCWAFYLSAKLVLLPPKGKCRSDRMRVCNGRSRKICSAGSSTWCLSVACLGALRGDCGSKKRLYVLAEPIRLDVQVAVLCERALSGQRSLYCALKLEAWAVAFLPGPSLTTCSE